MINVTKDYRKSLRVNRYSIWRSSATKRWLIIDRMHSEWVISLASKKEARWQSNEWCKHYGNKISVHETLAETCLDRGF